MGFLDFFRGPDMDAGVREYAGIPGAVLLDVRTPQEYSEGHVPGSRNVPLQTLDRMSEKVAGRDTPVFVYCQSGGRSRQAVALLGRMGYTRVRDIGGMSAYTGKVER